MFYGLVKCFSANKAKTLKSHSNVCFFFACRTKNRPSMTEIVEEYEEYEEYEEEYEIEGEEEIVDEVSGCLLTTHQHKIL